MKAWQLLDKPEKWTKKLFARTETGHPTCIGAEDAAQWCALGAVRRCYGEMTEACDAAVNKLASRVYEGTGWTNIGIWNDTSTYEDVHSLLKELDI